MQWHYAAKNGRICSKICFKNRQKAKKTAIKTIFIARRQVMKSLKTLVKIFFDFRIQMLHFIPKLLR